MFPSKPMEGFSERGCACAIRKILTSFGSGWKGLDPSFPIERAVAYRVRTKGEVGIPYNPGSHAQATLSLSEAKGYMPSRSELFGGREQEVVGLQLDRLAGFSVMRGPNKAPWLKLHGEVAEETIRSVEEAGKAAWKSNLSTLEKVVDNLMKSGEGSAISQAGTSAVPAVVRTASRIIKSL